MAGEIASMWMIGARMALVLSAAVSEAGTDVGASAGELAFKAGLDGIDPMLRPMALFAAAAAPPVAFLRAALSRAAWPLCAPGIGS